MRVMVPAVLAVLLCAPGRGEAQSVLLGGQIKLGLDSTSTGSQGRASRLTDNTSYFFFDGKEDLGNGLKAFYHLEWNFSADTGVQGAGRGIYMGLDSGRWGRLQLGRQSVYFSHHWFINDPHGAFDAAPLAANSLNVLGTINGAYFAGNFLNNTVRYEAPDFYGFSGMASYSFDAEQPGAGRNHTWYLAPTYTRGAFKAGFFHMQRDSQGVLPAQTVGQLDQTADRLAIGYTWRGFGFGLLADHNRVRDRASGRTQSRYAFAVPLNYNTGPHGVALTYGQALSMKDGGETVGGTGARMLSVSYQYRLSSRTSLDLSLIELRNQSKGRYNFWGGSLTGSPQLPAQDAGARSRMFYLGMKHLF